MQVILASKSPRRKDLLVQVGMDPLVMDSYVEEVTEALSPETLVRENAARKGRKLRLRWHQMPWLLLLIRLSLMSVASLANRRIGRRPYACCGAFPVGPIRSIQVFM